MGFPNQPNPLRADIIKTPGRLVFDPNGVTNGPASFYSKLNVPIERQLVYETFPVGTDAAGELDYRVREAYARVRLTPDGRFTSTQAKVLWPLNYRSYTAGQVMIPPTINPQLQIFAIDGTTELFMCSALEVMPPIKFAATETLIGQAEFICLRVDGDFWNTPVSLVTQTGQEGSNINNSNMPDPTFTPPGILTGPYYAKWNSPPIGLTIPVADTLEGITVEFNITWSDDNRQSIGLQNRRIKAINCRARFTPLGQLRAAILAAECIQGPGNGSPGATDAVRGRSIQGNSADLQILDFYGNSFMTLKNAALVDDKENWSVDQVRETDLVFQATRAFDNTGTVGPLFSIDVA